METRSAIIPVDIQQGFLDETAWGGARNNPAFEKNIERLFQAARAAGIRIIHVKHNSTSSQSPLRKGQPGNEFFPVAMPQDDEPVIEKSVNSGFIGTDLEATLHDAGITNVYIFGLTTDQCVSTTTRMAGNLGFTVRIIDDACATFPKALPNGELIDAETVHKVNLASLHNEFAEVVTTQAAVRELSKMIASEGLSQMVAE